MCPGMGIPRLTVATSHQGCMAAGTSGSVGRNSLARALLTRHSSFLALHLFMVAMYSLRPMPVTRTTSAACMLCCFPSSALHLITVTKCAMSIGRKTSAACML